MNVRYLIYLSQHPAFLNVRVFPGYFHALGKFIWTQNKGPIEYPMKSEMKAFYGGFSQFKREILCCLG